MHAGEGCRLADKKNGIPPSLVLTGHTNFTFSSFEAASMSFMGRMLRSREVHLVIRDTLKSEGFDDYWSPVDRLDGCLQWGAGEKLLVFNTTPWDGACEGRWETILRCTEHTNKKLVRDFFIGSTQPTRPTDF